MEVLVFFEFLLEAQFESTAILDLVAILQLLEVDLAGDLPPLILPLHMLDLTLVDYVSIDDDSRVLDINSEERGMGLILLDCFEDLGVDWASFEVSLPLSIPLQPLLLLLIDVLAERARQNNLLIVLHCLSQLKHDLVVVHNQLPLIG